MNVLKAILAFALLGASNLPVSAQALSPVAPTLPRVATTKMLAIGRLTSTATAETVRAVMPAEVRATVGLYLAGTLEQWYVRKDQTGVVFILNVTDVQDAHRLLEELPLGKSGLMVFDLLPIGPLAPLGLLLSADTPR